MNVTEIMNRSPRTFARNDDGRGRTAHVGSGLRHPPVVDDGELVGVVTDRYMYIALATQNARAAQVRVGAVAATNVVTCGPEDDVRAALESMRRARVRRLPVVGVGKTL